MTPTKQSAKPARKSTKAVQTFTAEERAAMRERVAEQRRDARSGAQADGEAEVLAKIAEMPPADRALAEHLHALIRARAPELEAKTWYGMPAYARKGQVLCFFQSAHRFKSRYATFGFSDKAGLDSGSLWPVAFALRQWDPGVEAEVASLLSRALG